jgi:hypothetical protein
MTADLVHHLSPKDFADGLPLFVACDFGSGFNLPYPFSSQYDLKCSTCENTVQALERSCEWRTGY